MSKLLMACAIGVALLGPTRALVDAAGLPIAWTISGATTFGSKIDERFAMTSTRSEWVDSTGKGFAQVSGTSLYVPQAGSPWSLGLAMLKSPTQSLPALPAGTLHLERGELLTAQGSPGPPPVTAYAISGTDLSPDYHS